MNLSSDQIQALKEGEPVQVVPPEVGQECVLLRRDVYDRIAHLLDDAPLSDEELTRLGWESGRQLGWDTPEMAQYDTYDAHKP